MSSGTFFFGSIVVPFVAISVFAPLIRKKSWLWAAVATTSIIAIDFALIRENFDTFHGLRRSVGVGGIALLAGWAYQRFFWDKDR